jgi:hypothetical protein
MVCLVLGAPALALHEPSLGFYCWREWRREAGKSDHEYLALTEWSAYGWAPPAVDLALTAGPGPDPGTRPTPVRVLVRLEVKVASPAFEPVAGRPDYAAMHRRARWQPVLTKKILLGGFRHGARIHLVSDIPLRAIFNDIWRRNGWPLELRAQVRLTGPKRTTGLPTTLQGVLPIIASD